MLALAIVVAGCAKGSERSEKPAAQAGATSGPTTSGATTSSATTPVTATSAPATPLPTATSVPTTLEEWERFDYSSSVVPATALTALPLVEVQRIRGIIFGKHGRVFGDTTIQHWLSTRPWYREDLDFTNARLSEGDRQNLEVVREAEAAKHTQIETGDMRFYENRVITTAMLGDHPPQDWEVLEAEVLANHGYVFAGDEEDVEPDEKHSLQPDALQKYFNERYWYHRDPNFAARQLSAIEQQNLDTIALAVMRQNKRSVSPGMMRLFQSTALTEPMLNNVNLADLRLLRNEIYALHGRPFQTGWIAEAFRQYPWYKPRADYSDTELSTVERANIALITKREEELHQDLATKMLTRGDVMGLRPEDARRLRNEIYARHGRRFQDPQLRRYFASFTWYKPNDTFRERQLSATERLNAELISQYEHGKFTEG
jgi:hypothetical protein